MLKEKEPSPGAIGDTIVSEPFVAEVSKLIILALQHVDS
jgi:hypothetical protein